MIHDYPASFLTSRSPMAEAVFDHQLKQRSSEVQAQVVKVDSCGTGAYHVGDEPDERTAETCKKVSWRFSESINEVQDGLLIGSCKCTAQGPNRFGRTGVVQERLSRIHSYPRHGPDEVSPRAIHVLLTRPNPALNTPPSPNPAFATSTPSDPPTPQPSSPSSPPTPPHPRQARNQSISSIRTMATG